MALDTYLALVTSQHRDKPKFVAALTAIVQPLADCQAVTATIPGLFDLDIAVGAQLDAVGQWIGRSRYLSQPLPNVYFSFDTAGLGFNEGTWLGPFDPVSGLVALPDDTYRTLLKAVVAANHWDGTIPEAYEIWATIFEGSSVAILIQDGGDMTMLFALFGGVPDAVTLALLTGGYIALRPAGVEITAYLVQSEPDAPYFGFDIENDTISGFDTGAFGEVLPAT